MNFIKSANAFLQLGFMHTTNSPSTAVFSQSRINGVDFQCNDVMAVAAKLGVKPRELAEKVSHTLKASNVFSDTYVSGPGFINVTLSDEYLLNCMKEMLTHRALGAEMTDTDNKVFIDFGGPNVAKPLHVGHLRSFVIGESLRRILTYVGYEVVSDIHLGDWGLQMGMLLYELNKRHPGFVDVHFSDMSINSLEEMYRSSAVCCKSDPEALMSARDFTKRLQLGEPRLLELWDQMRTMSLEAMQSEIRLLGAHFDLFLGESDTNSDLPIMLSELMEKNLLRMSEGALVVDLKDVIEGTPPLIVQKTDGAAIYGATDLATLRDRTGQQGANKIIYVVDRRQEQHLAAVFNVAEQAGYKGSCELVHVGFGTVNGKDGKPFKTRDGDTIKLGDLLTTTIAKAKDRMTDASDETAAMVGIGAIKYADLSTDRLSGYVFDLDRMTSFEGKTGPYLQYALTRIRSILNKAADLPVMDADDMKMLSHPAERELVISCLMFPVSVNAAVHSYQPKEIADRAFHIAQAFSRFYADCPVIVDGMKIEHRISLCELVSKVLGKCLYLLGINSPEKM